MQVCATLLVWLSAAAVGQTGVTTAPTDREHLNPRWLEPMQRNIESQIELLTAAYELDESAVRSLREESDRRLLQQVPLEQQYQEDKQAWVKRTRRRPGGAKSITPEERREFISQMKQRLENFPLNEKRVAEWVEQQLPAEVASKGHRRLEELWHRRGQQREAFVGDTQRRGAAKAQTVEALKAETATLTEAGKPLPNGPKQARVSAGAAKKIDLAQPVEPNQGVQPAADGPKPPPKIDTSRPRTSEHAGDKPTSTTGPPGEPKKVTPSPPLDEWDKYVAEAARKYAFSDAQIAKARANLAGMKNRANEYRRSHADDYAKADSIADAKLRAERLQQLDSPIDAFFEELKARLESLPTLEQRQKAEGGR